MVVLTCEVNKFFYNKIIQPVECFRLIIQLINESKKIIPFIRNGFRN